MLRARAGPAKGAQVAWMVQFFGESQGTGKSSQLGSLSLGFRGKISLDGDVSLNSKTSKGTGPMVMHGSWCGWRLCAESG